MEILHFLKFWAVCFCEGFKFSFDAFCILDGVCVVITALLYWTRDHHQKFWEEKGEPFVKKYAILIVLAQLAFGVICVAPYVQFRDEKSAKETALRSLDDKAPKLEGFVNRFMTADEVNTKNSLIFLDVSISNSGKDQSSAENYSLGVIVKSNRFVQAEEINFQDEYKLPFIHKNKPWQVDLRRRQLISEKTLKAIPFGEPVRGWLAFRVSGLSRSEYGGDIVFAFSDFNGKRSFATNGFWHGKEVSQTNFDDLTVVIPGAENIFYPIPPEGRTNWLPPQLPPGCTNIVVYFGSQSFSYSRQFAEIGPNVVQFAVKDLPTEFRGGFDSIANSGRSIIKKVFVGHPGISTTIAGKTFEYPIQPVVVSNRLYVEVEVPFSNQRKKLLMSDDFDEDLSPLPDSWDRNYSTNYDEYWNGMYYYEVVNELKNPVLQVGYAEPNVIFVNGIFQVDSNSIYAAFGQPPSLLTFSNYFRNDLQTTQRITTVSLKSDAFNEILTIQTNDTTADLGRMMTNELYRPVFQYQRRIFKYPSRWNLGAMEEYNKSDTNNINKKQ